MNHVQRYITETKEDAAVVLNELTARGLISDNCVTAGDVSDADGRFIWIKLGLREFAMLKRNEWITDPYQPWHKSYPNV